MVERPIATHRWLAKKAARALVARVGGRNLPGVRVLTYHRFGLSDRMPFTVTADAFEREMAFLAASGRAIALGDLTAHLDGTARLGDGSVLVTIDDADPTVATIAALILRTYGIPAVLYALGGKPEGFDVLSPGELRALADAGVTIGSHTNTHRSLAQLPRGEAETEARDSKARLEDWIGRAVTSFAYPFGTKSDVSPASAAILADAGYATGFTSLHGAIAGPVAVGHDRFLLPRVKVESGDPAWLFPALCGGAMDRWRIVDEGLSALQKPQSASA